MSILELIHEAEGFMPLYDGEDIACWIIPEEGKVPDGVLDAELSCERGGTVSWSECGHMVCQGSQSGEGISDGCALPAEYVVCTYAGTYYQPPEYEGCCSGCHREPDYEDYFEDRGYDD